MIGNILGSLFKGAVESSTGKILENVAANALLSGTKEITSASFANASDTIINAGLQMITEGIVNNVKNNNSRTSRYYYDDAPVSSNKYEDTTKVVSQSKVEEKKEEPESLYDAAKNQEYTLTF